MSAGEECLFCQRDDPDQNRIMVENRTCYIRYDNFPVAPGHVEIVPIRHVESFFGLTPAELADAYSLILYAHQHLGALHRPDGYTIGINEGRAAGRTIDHLHIHLIPRHEGDVPDPRGGIRRGLPNGDPDQWGTGAAGTCTGEEGMCGVHGYHRHPESFGGSHGPTPEETRE